MSRYHVRSGYWTTWEPARGGNNSSPLYLWRQFWPKCCWIKQVRHNWESATKPNSSLKGAFQFGEGHSNCCCHGLGHSIERADSNFDGFHPTNFVYRPLVFVIVGVMSWVAVTRAVPLLITMIRIVGGVAATLGWKWLMSGEEGCNAPALNYLFSRNNFDGRPKFTFLFI